MAFRTASSEESKRALKAARYLHDCGAWEGQIEAQAWAKRELAEEPVKLEDSISRLRIEIGTKLGQQRALKVDGQRDFERASRSWKQQVRAAREPFHALAQKAAELQWDLGPQFLVRFEDICRERGLQPETIPWDPARMLGWKLTTRGIEMTVYDLQVAAQEIATNALVDNSEGHRAMESMDGSYFTDYVHHIAISKPGVSARKVATDLTTRLLRPAQMVKLIKRMRSGKPMVDGSGQAG